MDVKNESKAKVWEWTPEQLVALKAGEKPVVKLFIHGAPATGKTEVMKRILTNRGVEYDSVLCIDRYLTVYQLQERLLSGERKLPEWIVAMDYDSMDPRMNDLLEGKLDQVENLTMRWKAPKLCVPINPFTLDGVSVMVASARVELNFDRVPGVDVCKLTKRVA